MKLKAIIVSSMLAALTACGGGGGSSTTVTDTCSELSNDSFDCKTMLQDINTVAVTKVTELETALTNFSSKVDNYCADTAIGLTDVKTEFSTTMAVMQQLDAMQFGPMAEARDDFYIWPSNSICRVDEQVATAPNAVLSSVDPARRGLTAVEYLLFESDVAAQCLALDSVDTWVNTTVTNVTERTEARCDFAKRIVDDLELKAATLKANQTAYDFSEAFDTLQGGANHISNALFYIDTQTKDVKIKAPLPQSSNDDFDAGKLESQFANVSKENIENNLLAAKEIIQAGIDDYLAVKGEQSLATNMVAAIDGALANITEIDGTLDAAITAADTTVSDCINLGSDGSYDSNSTDLEAYCALQWNIKTFTDLLKDDFVVALRFSTPATADGDND